MPVYATVSPSSVHNPKRSEGVCVQIYSMAVAVSPVSTWGPVTATWPRSLQDNSSYLLMPQNVGTQQRPTVRKTQICCSLTRSSLTTNCVHCSAPPCIAHTDQYGHSLFRVLCCSYGKHVLLLAYSTCHKSCNHERYNAFF
jgi:hypothetical protein